MCTTELFTFSKSAEERRGKVSLTTVLTLLWMGGSHALIDVYGLFTSAVASEEVRHVPCVKAHDGWIDR